MSNKDIVLNDCSCGSTPEEVSLQSKIMGKRKFVYCKNCGTKGDSASDSVHARSNWNKMFNSVDAEGYEWQ